MNYYTQSFIKDCIYSLFEYHDLLDVEIIIVNNGGSTDQIETMKNKAIQVIGSGNNSGFSRANNIGSDIAKGEFILFLNADTVFVKPVLEKLTEQLSANPTIGIVSCQLVNPDLSLQLSYHDGDHFFSKLWRRNPIAIKFFNATRRAKDRQDQIRNVHRFRNNAPWLSGACMLLRKSDIQKYNWYWDEDFFMYWEDVELCYRIRKQGYSVLYDPSVQLIHIGGGGEANFSAKRFNMMESSKLIFIRKSYGNFIYLLYIFLMKIELKIENWLEKRNRSKVENTLLQKELDFYFKRR